MMNLFKIYHPPVFQGNSKQKNYFEGWYFKQVSSDYQKVLAIIPGISYSSEPHAFIQLIDGKTGKTDYLTFPVDSFKAEKRTFDIWIAGNHFYSEGMDLDIDKDDLKLHGSLRFSNIVEWPVSLFSPGIMGWYRFVPLMECYHGVVSINHQVHGVLESSRDRYDFNNGYGYIEKDWGTSFPESWIWLHANCFPTENTALMLSVAKIPWRGKFFVGFLCFLQIGNQLFKFVTYNGSVITEARMEGNEVEISLRNKHNTIRIQASQLIAGELKAPVLGKMDRYIKESVDSRVKFELHDSKGNLLASSTSEQAGLEIVGDVISLL